MKNPNDRFGILEGAFKAAWGAHRSTGTFRSGMYVPTRNEVATLPALDLQRIVIDWMWEGPTELIPTVPQIAEVLALLEIRPDANELTALIAECRSYIKE
ncbi:MAG: hypothetical protein HY308_09375 [Gammaproteobacteria bacterium]|nr:hypothetical protein [Gammaproteobacteria bacterium]